MTQESGTQTQDDVLLPVSAATPVSKPEPLHVAAEPVVHSPPPPEPQLQKTAPVPPPRQVNVQDLFQKLQLLFKGTIYTAIYGLYTVFVGGMLLYVDWRAALLSFFVISVTHPLRYIANGVDKIGWQLTNEPVDPGVNVEAARAFQQKLLYGLLAAIFVCDLFLIGQAWFVSSALYAALSLLLFAAVEVMYFQVRKLERATEYKPADYGHF